MRFRIGLSTSGLAVLVALAALLVSVFTAYRGSSAPSEDARLRVDNLGQGEFSLAISNTGARSAIVDSIQVLASVNDRDREYCDVTDDSAADDNRAEPFVITPGDITLHPYSLPDPDIINDCFRDVKASDERYRAHLLVHTTDWHGRRHRVVKYLGAFQYTGDTFAGSEDGSKNDTWIPLFDDTPRTEFDGGYRVHDPGEDDTPTERKPRHKAVEDSAGGRTSQVMPASAPAKSIPGRR